jgi:hypothetical protein
LLKDKAIRGSTAIKLKIRAFTDISPLAAISAVAAITSTPDTLLRAENLPVAVCLNIPGIEPKALAISFIGHILLIIRY